MGSKILVFFYFCSSFSGPDGETKSLPNHQKRRRKTKKYSQKTNKLHFYCITFFFFLKEREDFEKLENREVSGRQRKLVCQFTTLLANISRPPGLCMHHFSSVFPPLCGNAEETQMEEKSWWAALEPGRLR